MSRIVSESRSQIGVVALLAVTPWLGVGMATAGTVVALHFLGLIMVLAGIGLLALRLGMGETGAGSTLLAVPLGFLLAAAVVALSARLGVSIRLVGWTLAIVGVLGLSFLHADLRAVLSRPVRFGWVYVLLSVVVCGLYFLPGALQDGVTTPGGGFQWMYVDTQFQMAIAAVVKTNHGPPAMPGMALAPLTYHFGPYALSGVLSAMTGLPLGDALARVVRGAGQIALILAALAFGRELARRVGDPDTGGIASVVGLLFYGSLSSLFVAQVNSTARGTVGAFLFPLPDVSVIHDGGWFSHLVLGHSEVWGGIGIFTVLALLASRMKSVARPRLRFDLFIVLPALIGCLEVIASIGTVGVVAGVYALLGMRHRRALLFAAGVLLAALGVGLVMGYVGSPSASGVALDLSYAPQALTLWVWLFIGLGVRLVAAVWWRHLRVDPLAWALLLFVVGYLAMGFLLRDAFDNHNSYGPKFLQGILSVYAFAWLGGVWGQGRRGWWETVAGELIGWAWRISVVLLVADGIATAVGVVRGTLAAGSISVWSLKLAALGSCGVIAGAGALWISRRTIPRAWGGVSRAVVAVMAVGFLAWLPPWTAYGLNRLRMQVVLSPEEVSALHWVRDNSTPDALIATNHNAVARFRNRQARSYGYRVLAERPILLEGWEYGEKYQARFAAVRHDNDVLFHTANADSARTVVQRYGVQYIVTAPGTDLHIAPSTDWLQLAARFGSVKVYRTE